jgi:hypothetical protein
VSGQFTNPNGSDTDYYVKVSSSLALTSDLALILSTTSPGQQNPLVISGNDTVWWFNGQTPTNYDTAITLTSSGGSATAWSVVDGSDKVYLSTSAGTQTTVMSTGSVFSQYVWDVTIRASVSGKTADWHVTTREPYKLIYVGTNYGCTYLTGYDLFSIFDQLNPPQQLPYGLPLNEEWTTPVHQDPGNNWATDLQARGTFVPIGAFSDHIQGDSLDKVPTPQCDPNNTDKILEVGQGWQIGSQEIGVGKQVQTDTLQKYVGTAKHLDIVSPVQP